MGTHRESARRGDADDGEGAEVNGALPRRRRLVRDRDVLLRLGLVLRRGLAVVSLICLISIVLAS